MQIAMIGLGRMGQNMAKRLIEGGHQIVGYDSSDEARNEMAKAGASIANSLAEISTMLSAPRVAWIMVPQGEALDSVVAELSKHFSSGDIIIDGGNSYFLASIAHHKKLKEQGISFVDIGVSGGIFGLERGFCLMVGGDHHIAQYLEPIFITLSPGEKSAPKTLDRVSNSHADQGFLYCGKSGSGHYVKMIHNAIEYGIMQSYAEGFELLHNAKLEELPEDQRYDFDVKDIAEVWRRGSVISSWLLDLLANALNKDAELNSFLGIVPDSGEGRWALIEAIKQGSPTPNLADSLFTRFRSRQNKPFSERVLSALRKEFGGHKEGSKSSD